MAYPYTHVTRSNGTILTATIYNTDHQNHIDHNIPEDIDDFSINAAEMQTATDPGEVGSESLATSLSEELARLRFAIKEMKGTAQWYETVSVALSQVVAADPITLTNKTGAGLVAGDVVAIDIANDSAVALDDTLSSVRRFVVAGASINNNAAGIFYRAGMVPMLAQGAITRGNWVIKSATTKAVADSGFNSTTHSMPVGAIGIALEAGVNATVGDVFMLEGPSVAAQARLANAVAILGRNAANAANIELLKVDSSDRTVLGPGSTANVIIAGQTRHDINASDRIVLPVGADKWAV